MKTNPIYPDMEYPCAGAIIVHSHSIYALTKAVEMFHYLKKNEGYAPQIIFVEQKHSVTELFFNKSQNSLVRDICANLGVEGQYIQIVKSLNDAVEYCADAIRATVIGTSEELAQVEAYPAEMQVSTLLLQKENLLVFSMKSWWFEKLFVSICCYGDLKRELAKAQVECKRDFGRKFAVIC